MNCTWLIRKKKTEQTFISRIMRGDSVMWGRALHRNGICFKRRDGNNGVWTSFDSSYRLFISTLVTICFLPPRGVVRLDKYRGLLHIYSCMTPNRCGVPRVGCGCYRTRWRSVGAIGHLKRQALGLLVPKWGDSFAIGTSAGQTLWQYRYLLDIKWVVHEQFSQEVAYLFIMCDLPADWRDRPVDALYRK
jgi:hypothetical protein